MPDEIADQPLDLTPGAAEATIEAPAGVVENVVEAVAGEIEAVPATPISFDLSTDDGIRSAIEANQTLAGYIARQQADAANTARQRRDAEIRREQGTVEVAQAHTRWLAEQIANGADPDELGRQVPHYVKANADTIRAEYGKAILQQAAERGDETVKQLLENLSGNPDDVVKVAQAAYDATIARARSEAIAETEARLRAEFNAKAEADQKAAALEQQLAGRTNPPNVRGGAGGLSTSALDRYEGMSSNAWADLVRSDPKAAADLQRQANEERSRLVPSR